MTDNPTPIPAQTAEHGRALPAVALPYMMNAGGETVADLVDRRGSELLELPE